MNFNEKCSKHNNRHKRAEKTQNKKGRTIPGRVAARFFSHKKENFNIGVRAAPARNPLILISSTPAEFMRKHFIRARQILGRPGRRIVKTGPCGAADANPLTRFYDFYGGSITAGGAGGRDIPKRAALLRASRLKGIAV